MHYFSASGQKKHTTDLFIQQGRAVNMEGNALAGFKCIAIAGMNGHGHLMCAPVDFGQCHMGILTLFDSGVAIDAQV